MTPIEHYRAQQPLPVATAAGRLIVTVAALVLVGLPIVGGAGEPHSAPSPFKGEYFVTENKDDFCVPYARNLNQFRRLEFDACHPRLSAKYPEFTWPAWEELPLDLTLVERVVRNWGGWYDDAYWAEWLKVTESLRREGKVKLWRVRIDIDADGTPETLLRLEHPLMRKDPAAGRGWVADEQACPYRNSIVYMSEYEPQEPARRLHADPEQLKKNFNSGVMYINDIIHFSGAKASPGQFDGYYAIDGYITLPSSPIGHSIGATRGLRVYQLGDWGPGKACHIDWVPTGRYRPLGRVKPARGAME
jgi:hypothetical protein